MRSVVSANNSAERESVLHSRSSQTKCPSPKNKAASASLVDHKYPTEDLFALQPADGCSAFSDVAHSHEREASRVAGRSIFNDVDSGDGSELLEAGPKIRFGSLGGEIPT